MAVIAIAALTTTDGPGGNKIHDGNNKIHDGGGGKIFALISDGPNGVDGPGGKISDGPGMI